MNDNCDLTLAKNLQNEVTENIFEQIVLSFPDIIHSVDQNGVIISTNDKATELLGYTREEIIGTSVLDLYADEIREQVKKGFSELKVQGLKDRIESKLKTKDGNTIDVEIRSLSIYNKKGEFVKTFSIIRDMRAMNALKNQLIQQSKLAAIGELASGIMHDIRNPLTVITSYNNYFLKQALETGDFSLAQKCQKNIEKSTQRIQRLSDHLREYSRSEDDTMEEFNLKTLIEDGLLMLESRIKKSSVVLSLQIPPEMTLVGKPNDLEQVFINILGNACDALSTYNQGEKKVIVSAETSSDQVHISIQDNGPGIPRENLDKIFDAFFTTKPKGDGTGLGLSICKGIIKDQGGDIQVKSSPGQGAEFIITLPKVLKPNYSANLTPHLEVDEG